MRCDSGSTGEANLEREVHSWSGQSKTSRIPYQELALSQLNVEQSIQALLGRARDLPPFFSPERWRHEPGQAVREEVPKAYRKPTPRKITPEQASLMLIGYASVGNQGAKDL